MSEARIFVMRQTSGIGAPGFTLLEVLLAMVLLAVVLTTIYASFSSAGASVQHAEEIRDSTDLARTLVARLSTDLANAYCRPGMQGTFFYGKKVEIGSEGEQGRADSIALTTLTHWRSPNSKETELWEVGYFFKERPEGGFALMRRELAIPGSEDLADEAQEYEITDAVRGLQLRYSDGAKWQDELGGTKDCKRPVAVEIALTMQDGQHYLTKIALPKVVP